MRKTMQLLVALLLLSVAATATVMNIGSTTVEGATITLTNTSTGDAEIGFGTVLGTNVWTMGLDNSTTNNDLVLSTTALGTGNVLSINGSTKYVTLTPGLNIGINAPAAGDSMYVFAATNGTNTIRLEGQGDNKNQLIMQAAAPSGAGCLAANNAFGSVMFKTVATAAAPAGAEVRGYAESATCSASGQAGYLSLFTAATATSPTERVRVTGAGVVRILGAASGKPTCDSTQRGGLWTTQSGAGVKDAFEVCAKDATDAYAWRAIY